MLAASCVVLAALCRLAAAQGIDPALRVGITRTNQSVILKWFGSNAVPYQVESSTNLTTWTNASSIVTGSGSEVFATNPVAGQSPGFFRVKRLPPGGQISATFDSASGTLTVVGDDADNVIVVSRNAAGAILVNGGAIPIQGGLPTVANTGLIEMFGRAGNDQLSLDELNGALPRARLFGELGNDTLIGGSGDDVLDGGPGSDTLLGKGGADMLFGGDGNDTLTGGDGDDQVFGEAGDDRIIWNPGDDTDLNEGGDGIDTVEINGGNGAEVFTTTANGTRVRFDRVSPAPFSLDIGTCEKLVLNANGGNDSFSATGNLAALIQITVDGGPGDDTLLGSNGNDVLIGGDGNDFIDGQQGNDTINLGAGDDTFQWNPGDGNDTVEGQGGIDTVIFNGANIAETFEISPNGSRVRLTRSIGSIVLDLDGIERLNLNTLGGVDAVTVNDLTGTDLTSVSLDLASTIGGSAGDGLADTVTVNGSGLADTINITANLGAVEISGLDALVRILHPEVDFDNLIVNGLGGIDAITTDPSATTLIKVTVNQ